MKQKQKVFRDEELGIVFKERNLNGSLEEATDELAEAYSNYKELTSRCTIDFQKVQGSGAAGLGDFEDDNQVKSLNSETPGKVADNQGQDKKKALLNAGKNSHLGPKTANDTSDQATAKNATSANKTKVFYFKPDSFLVADPERQKQFRKKLIDRIKEAPQIRPPQLMADDLQLSLIEAVADRSDPREMRQLLANYFKRKLYTLQHKRYKLLLRWAHHAVRTRHIETIGQHATFRCSKLQWEIDSTNKRIQRLDADDDYNLALSPQLRPSSKSKKDGGTLYVEIKDLPPQSCIRQDDIEVYQRHITYSGKINKLANKFLARLKWMALAQRFQIFQTACDKYFEIRTESTTAQLSSLENLEKYINQTTLQSKERTQELKIIRDNAYITQYMRTMPDAKQKILGSCRPDYQISPDMVNNCPEMKIKIIEMAKQFGLKADLGLDDGYSFAYQLTLFFPSHFQKQIIKSQFSIYDAFAGQNDDQQQLQKRNFNQMQRVDPNIFRDISTNSNLLPSEESMMEEISRYSIKLIRLKEASWVYDVIQSATIPDWQRKQDAILIQEDNKIDTLLSGCVDLLDVNDLASVNLVISEQAQIYMELVQKQQMLDEKIKLSKVYKSVDVLNTDVNQDANGKDDSSTISKLRIYQTVSATNIQEMNNNFYVQMTNALTGANVKEDPQKQNEKEGEELRKRKQQINKKSLFYLQQHLISSFITLRYMSSREVKIKIMYCLNYFRSIQKRLMMDQKEMGTCERALGDVVDPIIPAHEADQQIVDTLQMILMNSNKALKAAQDGKLSHIEETKESGVEKINRLIKERADKNQAGSGAQQTSMANNYSILDKEKMHQLLCQEDGTSSPGLSLIDLKKIRLNGNLHQKHLSTSPIMPRFHATFGEPSEVQPQFVQNDREKEEIFISKESMKLLNRIDHIEIEEQQQEVYVRDDFGIYIMYECSLTDMQVLEQELIRIGSFYISKMEELFDTEVDKFCHKKDRQQVLDDLLNNEMHFQFKKVLLAQLYMECYEHISDPVDMQRLSQIIIDTMARRPRLNLDCFYFQDSYKAEIECIEKNIQLLDLIIINQIKLEKLENTNLHEALNLSYSLAQKKEKQGWQYEDAEKYMLTVIEQFEKIYKPQLSQTGTVSYPGDQGESQSSEQSSTQKSKALKTQAQKLDQNTIEKDAKSTNYKDLVNLRYSDLQLDSEAFTKLLGLPKVTLEQIFNQSKENDEFVQDIMNEQSHFVNLIEGYPDLMTLKQSGPSYNFANYRHKTDSIKETRDSQGNETFSAQEQKIQYQPDQVQDISFPLSKWLKRPEAMSIMDFYQDSLSFVNKLYATVKSCYIELVDILKPHDNMLCSLIEAQIYENAIIQFREMQSFLIGEKTETRGHQYIESEWITGSSDKMQFYSKELASELQSKALISVNPFLVSKLDLASIRNFKFPQKVKADQNPYYQQQRQAFEGHSAAIAIAIQKFEDPSYFQKHYSREHYQSDTLTQSGVMSNNQDQQEASNQDQAVQKQVLRLKVPSLLQLQCNSIELLRLRNELILCLTECAELEKIYKSQAGYCKLTTWAAQFSEGLAFEHGLSNQGEINYIDGGPASMLDIELAINELDPLIASNLNFRNVDAFKIMITDAGLEEVRTVVHYQLMQKQALIVATRTNQILIDAHQRAEQELELARKGYALPNMVINVNQIFSKLSDGVDSTLVNRMKSSYHQNLINNMQQQVISVLQWKNLSRTSLGKQYQIFLAQCEKRYWQKEVKLRLLRAYKVSLFNQYCNQCLEIIHANSVKYNLISQCQKLRAINQYFQFDPNSMNIQMQSDDTSPKFSQLFNLETNDLMENYFYWYQPSKFEKDNEQHFKRLQRQLNSENQGINANANSATAKKVYKIETIDPKRRQLVDFFSIPSSKSLVQLDAFQNQEEQLQFVQSSLEKITFDIELETVEGAEYYDKILPNLNQLRRQTTESSKRMPDFSKSNLAQMQKYFHCIYNIIQLELSISKFSFSAPETIEMDNSIQNGLSFFDCNNQTEQICSHDINAIINSGAAVANIEQTQTGQTIKQGEETLTTKNKLAAQIVRKMFQKKRQKTDFGEEFYNIAQKVQLIIKEAQKHSEKTQNYNTFSTEYLETYEKIRYLQIICIVQKLSEKFYEKDDFYAGQALNNTLLALAKRDNVRIVSQNGAYHVNSAELDPELYDIDSSSLTSYFGNLSELRSFKQTVFPILSDKALEPPEITLLESIYLNNQNFQLQDSLFFDSDQKDSKAAPEKQKNLKNQSYSLAACKSKRQYCGKPSMSKPFYCDDLSPLQTHLLCMPNSHRKYISSNLRQIEYLVKDYLTLITQENIGEDQTVLSLSQLNKSLRFLTDQIESRQLKQANLCFIGQDVPSKINSDKQLRKKIEELNVKEFFWKVLQEMDLLKEAQDSRYRNTVPEKQREIAQQALEAEIFRLQKIVDRKITEQENAHATKLQIKVLEEEQKQMKKNVLMYQILKARAEITVYQNNIERNLIISAVKTLDSECSALANCLKNQSKEIDAFVHPFQQFAVTQYDQVDRQSHLDVINKCSQVQTFITRLKNRGTEVETLTSGPGYVFTLKDINDCIASLSKGLVKYAETELRTRSEMAAKKEYHYLDLLYLKDQKIDSLERRISEQVRIVDKIVNSRLYQRGNQIVYDLDQANRTIKLLKDNINRMEDSVRREIDGQYKYKVDQREHLLRQEMKKFADFRAEIVSLIKSGTQEDKEEIKKQIKRMADAYKNLDSVDPVKFTMNRAKDETKWSQVLSPVTSANQRVEAPKDTYKSLFPQSVSPQRKAQRKEEYDLSQPYDFPSRIKEEWQLSEQEAREELDLMVTSTRRMFIFWKFKEITTKQLYENKLFDINTKLTNNTMLWEQLAEAQKKEKILRQELQMTQQALSDCEKIIEKQKEHISKVETEKVRLLNFKTNKGHRLEELEQKVSFYEIYEKINVDKLIFTLTQQQNELKTLRNKSSNYEQEVQQIRKRNADELNKVYKKFQQEISIKIQAIQSFDRMREQIKNIDQRPDASAQIIWKEKCHELFKICVQLQEENQQLSERCKQMAEIAVNLAQNINKYGSLSPAKGEKTDTTNLLRQQQNLDHQAKNLKILSQRRQMTRKSEVQLPNLTNSSQKQNINVFSSKVFDAQQLFQKNFIKEDQANITSNEQSRIFDYAKISDPQKKASGGRPHKRGKSLLEIKREIDQHDRDSMRRNIIIGKQIGKEEQKEGTQSGHGFSTTQSRGSRNLEKAPQINKNVAYIQESFISTNSKPFNDKKLAFSNNSKIESQQFDYNSVQGLSPIQKIRFPPQR